MRKVRAQIQALHKNASLEDQHKMVLGVGRRLSELTVKGMAMDAITMEKVVRVALREPIDGAMPLTRSIKDVFDVRSRELASAPVRLSTVQAMLDKRDYGNERSDARQSDVRDLARHLCNELNSVAPLNKATLAFLMEVNKANALGMTTEDWTLNTWKAEFAAYAAKTPRGMNSVVFGLTQMHLKNPSLASLARHDGAGATELIHSAAHSRIVDELRNIPTTLQGNVVRALFEGDHDSARSQVLLHRNAMFASKVVHGANLDTSALDSAGLSM